MKKVMLGIFAHPDDETFGPSGTLLKLKDEAYDICLILLTDGEAGTNPDGVPDLGKVRIQEWLRAGNLMGVSNRANLQFPDGALQTIPETVVDTRIQGAMRTILAGYPEPIELSVMTFEPEGLTGHLDHVAASKAAERLYGGLDTTQNVRRGQLCYYCLDKTQAPLDGTAYYEPRARSDDFITDRIDVRGYLPRKYELIDQHVSQRADAATLKALGDDVLATECFCIVRGPTGQVS